MHDFPWEQRRSRGYESIMLPPRDSRRRQGRQTKLKIVKVEGTAVGCGHISKSILTFVTVRQRGGKKTKAIFAPMGMSLSKLLKDRKTHVS